MYAQGRWRTISAVTLSESDQSTSIVFTAPVAGEGGPDDAHAGPDGTEVLIMQYLQPDSALLGGASAPYSTDDR